MRAPGANFFSRSVTCSTAVDRWKFDRPNTVNWIGESAQLPLRGFRILDLGKGTKVGRRPDASGVLVLGGRRRTISWGRLWAERQRCFED